MHKKEVVTWLKNYSGRPLRLMEVCGTHTSALYRTGLKQLLSESIEMLSGPGCPVCVTPSAYIDKLIEYAQMPNCCVLTFGDMLAVPGSKMSLAQAKALGAKVDYFYTPEEALEKAKENKEILYVFAAVGFETTAPVWATLILRAKEENITNVKFLTALKTMPRAIASLCERGDIDGFLCPGHVAVITGNEDFRNLGEKYNKTMVVGGFSSEQLVRAMGRLVLEASRSKSGFWNEYPSVVNEQGNEFALKLLRKVFVADAAAWRGLGVLENSGLYMRQEFAQWDAGSRGLDYDKLPAGCQCGKVLLGKVLPQQCPCFGKACTPEHPVGACMVSGEGTCCITYREGDWEEDD